MSYNNTTTLTLGFTNTDFTRKFKIDDIAEDDLPAIKNKILAVNASLAAGTDGGLADFFRSDDFDASDPNNVVGRFCSIVAAQTESSEIENIPLN